MKFLRLFKHNVDDQHDALEEAKRESKETVHLLADHVLRLQAVNEALQKELKNMGQSFEEGEGEG